MMYYIGVINIKGLIYMKKLLFALLFIGAIIAVVFFLNKKSSVTDLSDLFDEKPPSVSGNTSLQVPENLYSDKNTEENKNTPASENTDFPNNIVDDKLNSDVKAEPIADENANTESSSSESIDKTQNEIKENTVKNEQPAFSHSDTEKQMIIGRYIEAEEFYYSMLYQQFDLDSYDVIVRKNKDGYSAEYHRVLYFDVNSKAELKAHYREYFTDNFVTNLDLSSYIEENGKLYCAETGNASSSKGTKYKYNVESTDENNAVIIRTQAGGSGTRKINAVKINGKWYFDSVAIK